MKTSLSFLRRLLTAIVGLFVGGLLGMFTLALAILVFGSDFGLDNVRPGFIPGAIIGVFVGWCRPGRWSWLDFLVP